MNKIKYWTIRLVFVDLPIGSALALAIVCLCWSALGGPSLGTLVSVTGWAFVVVWLWSQYRDARRSERRRFQCQRKTLTHSGTRGPRTWTGSRPSEES